MPGSLFCHCGSGCRHPEVGGELDSQRRAEHGWSTLADWVEPYWTPSGQLITGGPRVGREASGIGQMLGALGRAGSGRSCGWVALKGMYICFLLDGLGTPRPGLGGQWDWGRLEWLLMLPSSVPPSQVGDLVL